MLLGFPIRMNVLTDESKRTKGKPMKPYTYYVVLFCNKWKLVPVKHWESIKTLPKFGIVAKNLAHAKEINFSLHDEMRFNLAELNKTNRI